MAEDIIDHYIDRNGIKQDTAFLIAELNAVLAKVKEVNDVNRTLGGANTFGLAVKLTKELNTAVTGLSTSYTGLATATRTVAAAQSNSNTTLDGHIERLTRNKSMLADNVKLQKELKKELDAGRISQETYTQKIINTTKRQLEYKNAIANSNAEIKNAAKLAYSVPGSIGQAKAQNIQLRKVADTIPVNEIERLKEVNDLIDRNNILIDANSDKLSRQKINIGNYPTEFKQAFGTLENELEKVNKQIVSGNFSGKEFDGLIAKQSALQSGVTKLGQEFATTGAATTAYKNVAKDLGSTFGINSTVFREFNANVGAGSKELNKVNEAVKGAEKSGSKLGGIFQSIGGGAVKLARLLPGIGIAGLIGFAIQPIIDYISNIKKADTVTKLIADDIDKAGGSFQKAATEVYGLKENIKLAKEGFLDKDKVLNEYNTTIGKTIGQVTSLDQAEQEITAKGSAYIQMTLLKAAANIALEEAAKKAFEAAKDNLKADTDFLKYGDLVAQGFTNLDEVGVSSADAAESRKNDAIRRAAENQQRLEDEKFKQLKIAEDFQKQAAEIAKKFKFDFFGGTEDKKGGKGNGAKAAKEVELKELLDREYELYTIAQKRKISLLKDGVDDESKSFDERLQLLNDYSAAALEIEQRELNSQVSSDDKKIAKLKATLSKLSGIELKNAVIDIANLETQKDKLKAQFEVTRLSIIEDNVKKEREIIRKNNQEIYKDAVELQKQKSQLVTDAIDSKSASEALKVQQEYELKIIAASGDERAKLEKELADKLAKIAAQSELDKTNYLILQLKARIELLKAFGFNVAKLNADLANAEKKASEESIKLAGDTEDKKAKIKEAKLKATVQDLETVYQFEQQAAALITGLNNARYTEEKNKIQDVIDAIDKKRAIDIEAVNRSTRSEQDKAAAIARINATADVKKQQQELKQREADQKHARFEKAANIAQITITTALAVIKAFADGKTPADKAIGAALAATTGAVSLATAIATPIPKFKDGKTGNYEGLAIVGDGGKREPIFRADSGTIELSPAKDTLTHIGARDIVWPSIDAMLKQIPMPKLNGMITTANQFNDKGIINAIKEQQTTAYIMTKQGVKAITANQAAFNEYIKRTILN